MSVTSKESSRCIWPWPAASRLIKTIRWCLTDQECRIAVEHVNDIPVNEPWPSCILAETWHVKAYSRWRGKLGRIFNGLGEMIIVLFLQSNRLLAFVTNSPTRFSLHLRALEPSRVVCARCFFGQPQLPRLIRSSNSASNRRDSSKRFSIVKPDVVFKIPQLWRIVYWCFE